MLSLVKLVPLAKRASNSATLLSPLDGDPTSIPGT